MTVRGPIAAEEMGITLAHEHLMSTVGMDITPLPDFEYAYEDLAREVLPHLRRVREHGCATIVDAGPAYIGRAPEALRRLSEESGIHLITTTGYYGAAADRYLPVHAWRETADQLAERWLDEWRNGIGSTGIRPGLIKVGVDPGPLTEIDATLVRAAARVHRESGLTVASHTGGSPAAAQEQLHILREEGVAPDAWIWVHAQGVEDVDELARVAEAGGWISLDGVDPDSARSHAQRVLALRDLELLGRVLVSHDGIIHRPGSEEPRAFEALFTVLIPLLQAGGLGSAEIRQLLVENPREALTIRERLVA